MRQSWTSGQHHRQYAGQFGDGVLGLRHCLVLPEAFGDRDFEAVQSSHVDLPRKRHPLAQVGDTSPADQAEGEIRQRRQHDERSPRVGPDAWNRRIDVELGQRAVEIRQQHEPCAPRARTKRAVHVNQHSPMLDRPARPDPPFQIDGR